MKIHAMVSTVSGLILLGATAFAAEASDGNEGAVGEASDALVVAAPGLGAGIGTMPGLIGAPFGGFRSFGAFGGLGGLGAFGAMPYAAQFGALGGPLAGQGCPVVSEVTTPPTVIPGVETPAQTFTIPGVSIPATVIPGVTVPQIQYVQPEVRMQPVLTCPGGCGGASIGLPAGGAIPAGAEAAPIEPAPAPTEPAPMQPAHQ